MRFNIGDKVRHRGLRWLCGIVEEIYEAERTQSDDGRSYHYKVFLEKGSYYIDRGSEWESIPAGEENSEVISDRGVNFEDSVPPDSD